MCRRNQHVRMRSDLIMASLSYSRICRSGRNVGRHTTASTPRGASDVSRSEGRQAKVIHSPASSFLQRSVCGHAWLKKI
jgi:hypothetical protein